MKKKIIRITTIPNSLCGLLTGQLRFMNGHYEMVGVSCGGDMLDKVQEQEGVRVVPITLTRKITLFQDLKSVYQLYRLFKKEKPFIVHSHTPKAGTAGMIAAKLAGVPHRLHTIAGLPLLEASGAKRKILNLVEKITYACATKIYPNSYGLKDIILDHKFTTPNKLKVIGNGSSNGIDTSHFDPNLFTNTQKVNLKKELNISNDNFVFIYVGRFVKDKGINELIAAFVNVNKNYPTSKLLLVGGYENHLDPLLKETENLINTHQSIITTGWVGDVRPYFAISDVLVFPSYREGFPNVVMQSGAMGLFSIVTDINGCNEIIIPTKNGTIIPVKNVAALENAMILTINEREKAYFDPKEIRQMIIDRYEQKIVWRLLKDEYSHLHKVDK